MKVLIINSVCGVGSTGRICTDIADVLIKQGHQCKIAYGREKVPEKYKKIAIRITSKFDVYFNAIKARLFDNEGFNAKRATKKLIKRIKEYNPDVIHLHNLHGYYINIEILFKYLKVCGKRIIWTLHDCWAFTGHCAYFSLMNCNKWQKQCMICQQKKLYPKTMTDNSQRNFNKKKSLFTNITNLTIVTPSRWLAELVKESFLKEHKIKVINNGIDLSVFKPTPSNFREKYNIDVDKFVILGIAYEWDKRKGLDVFIELAERLSDRYKIVLVGTKKETDKQLPEKIISIQKTDNSEDLAKIYTAADLFVNPTREENYPTVNMEAIACGTPVLTFDTGGSKEIIDETCGAVVERDDIKGLENEIKSICENRRYSKKACLARAKSFDMYLKFAEYIKFYNSIGN